MRAGPRCADLAGDFLPFDRAALERAVDRFLDQFEGLTTELARFDASTAAVAPTTLAAGRPRPVCHPAASALAAPAGDAALNDQERFSYFTGLPKSWSWGLAET